MKRSELRLSSMWRWCGEMLTNISILPLPERSASSRRWVSLLSRYGTWRFLWPGFFCPFSIIASTTPEKALSELLMRIASLSACDGSGMRSAFGQGAANKGGRRVRGPLRSPAPRRRCS